MNWRNRLRVNLEPNEVFGRLTVVKELSARQHTPTGRVLRTFQCKCECGNFAEIPLTRLRSGATKSCGCLHKDALKAANERKAAKVIGVRGFLGQQCICKKNTMRCIEEIDRNAEDGK